MDQGARLTSNPRHTPLPWRLVYKGESAINGMGGRAPEARGARNLAPHEPAAEAERAANGRPDGVHLQCERRGWGQVSGGGGETQRVDDASAPCRARIRRRLRPEKTSTSWRISSSVESGPPPRPNQASAGLLREPPEPPLGREFIAGAGETTRANDCVSAAHASLGAHTPSPAVPAFQSEPPHLALNTEGTSPAPSIPLPRVGRGSRCSRTSGRNHTLPKVLMSPDARVFV